MEKLTKQQQIEVLENIDWKDLIYYKDGLCFGIKISLSDTLHMNIDSTELKELIPLFTRENILKFEAHPRSAYWWSLDVDGFNCRKSFIDWIINELKKEL